MDPVFQQENTSISNIEHDQDENEQFPMPIIYKKRVRTKFSQEQVGRYSRISDFDLFKNNQQLDVLEATFQQHRYPTVDVVDDLVEQLDLPTQKITVRSNRNKSDYLYFYRRFGFKIVEHV